MAQPRRNANGEGTVFLRKKDSRWVAELPVNWGTPQQYTLRDSFDKKADAEKQRRKWLTQRDEGTLVKPNRNTVAGYVEEWIDTTACHEVGPSTVQIYRNMLEWYIKPHLSRVTLADVKPTYLRTMYHTLLTGDKPKSPRTVQILHGVLRRAFTQAVTDGDMSKNPCSMVNPPRLEEKEQQFLRPEQFVAFIKAAQSERLHALLVLAVTTGLRMGELLGLRWSDVNLDAGELSIRQAAKCLGSVVTFSAPKTKKSKRDISLPSIAVESLRRWRLEQAQERFKLAEAWAHPELVFTTEVGTPILRWNLRKRAFHRVLKRAGLPQIRFHDLRHTAATILLTNDVNPRVVQELLGHSRVGVTLDTYSHVIGEKRKEAAEKVNSFLAAYDEKPARARR